MQHLKLTGIVLKRQPLLETDRIITVFSQEHGIVRVMAKGVRRSGSRRSCHLDLFTKLAMEVEISGIGTLGRAPAYLREVQTVASFKKLKKSVTATAAASLIASFLLRTVPPFSHQDALYTLTCETFERLQENEPTGPILLSYFLKTMEILGLLPGAIPEKETRAMLWKSLQEIDPQFTLTARRTLGIFSSAQSTDSN